MGAVKKPLETFRGATAHPQLDLPLWPDPPPRPDVDPILTGLVGPLSDLKSALSGPNQVEIGSKSGPKTPNQVRGDGGLWVLSAGSIWVLLMVLLRGICPSRRDAEAAEPGRHVLPRER